MEIVKSKVDFLLFNEENLEKIKDSSFITGFYGIGKCGFIAVNHLVRTFNAERIGVILTSEMPPYVSQKKGVLSFPFEIYFVKLPNGEKLSFLLPSFEPYKTEHQVFSEELIKWLIKNQVKRIILFGGLDSRLRNNDQSVGRILYSRYYNESFQLPELPLFEEGMFLTGPLAYLLMFSELYRFPALAILTYAERSRPDPIAASKGISILSSLFKVEIDVSDLMKEAEKIKEEIKQIISSTVEKEEENLDRGLFA